MSRKTPTHDKLTEWVNAQTEPFTRGEMIAACSVGLTYSKKFIATCAKAGALMQFGHKRGKWARVPKIPVPAFKSRMAKEKIDCGYQLQELNQAGPSIIAQALASRPLLVLVFDAAIRAQDSPRELIAA